MAVEEENPLFSVEPGCSVHGDGLMRECSMCGAEFCRGCHPRSTVCPDCAELSDEEEKDADMEEVGADDEEEDEELDEDEASPEDALDDKGEREY